MGVEINAWGILLASPLVQIADKHLLMVHTLWEAFSKVDDCVPETPTALWVIACSPREMLMHPLWPSHTIVPEVLAAAFVAHFQVGVAMKLTQSWT